jgi:hypothetical protein
MAREVAEEREARLSNLEERCGSLIVLLEKVVRQTGTRVSAEDQGMMERLERLEEQMGRFGEKLETVVSVTSRLIDDHKGQSNQGACH